LKTETDPDEQKLRSAVPLSIKAVWQVMLSMK